MNSPSAIARRRHACISNIVDNPIAVTTEGANGRQPMT